MMLSLHKFCILLLLALSATSADAAVPEIGCEGSLVISKISNDSLLQAHHLYGGIMGGGTLYIHGSGFDSKNYTNQVMVGSIACVVNDYYTTGERIVCHIEPKQHHPQNNLQVAVKACGKIAMCNDNDCTMNLEYNRTPMMHYVVPQAVFQGDQIGITGIWRTDKYSDLKEVSISNQNCIISDEQNESANLSFWSTRKIDCQVPDDMEIGYHTISVTGQSGTGLSQGMRSSQNFRVGHETTTYSLRVHPKIEHLSSQSGFLNGQKIVIKGHGFGSDISKIKVTLSENQAKVLRVWRESKEVITKNEEGEVIETKTVWTDMIEVEISKLATPFTDKIFNGGVGLSQFVWQRSWTNWEELMGDQMVVSGVPQPVTKGVMLSTENYFDKSSYTQFNKGIFKTGEAGVYKFKISADDDASLYLSTNPIDKTIDLDTKTMLEKKCYIDSWTSFREFHRSSEEHQHCEYTLEANKDYYMMIFQTEGGGGDHITVGVTTPNTDTVSILPNRSPNVQEISVNYTPTRKEYTIKIMNAISGSYKLTWAHMNTEKQKYDYFRETRDIQVGADTDQISYEIRRGNGVYNEVTRQNLLADGSITNDPNAAVKGFLITVKQTAYWGWDIDATISTKDLAGDSPTVVIDFPVKQSPPVRGTFTLTYAGVTTTNIGYNYGAFHIIERLQVIPELTGGLTGYTHGSRDDGYTWKISFDSVQGNANKLEFVSLLKAEAGNGYAEQAISITINEKYIEASNDLVYLPIPPDMLRSYSVNPQIVIEVDGNLAGCIDGDCDYKLYGDAATPVVESFSQTDNELTITLKAGYELMETPEGVLLNTLMTLVNMEVRFGNSNCKINNITLPVIKCDLDENTNGTAKIEYGSWTPFVHLKNFGFFKVEDGVLPTVQALTVSSVSPAVGSTGGGTTITISGVGFAINSVYNNTSVVKIGNVECAIKEFSNNSIKCETPEMTGSSEAVNLTIQVNGHTVTSTAFSYSDAITPKITSLSPNNSSPVLKKDLIINGTGFDTVHTKFKVWLKPVSSKGKEYECWVVSSTTTQITCRLSGGQAGDYLIKVHQAGIGYSKPGTAGDNAFKYVIKVTSITPSSGSLEGGTVLTIVGENFSTITNENQVVIGDSGLDYCIVTDATAIELKCKVNKPLEVLSGVQKVYVLGRAREEATCDMDNVCVYTFDANKTPIVTDMQPRVAVTSNTITVTGTGFKPANAVVEVFIGDAKGINVTIISETSLTFEFPNMGASSHPPKIHFVGEGYAQMPKITSTVDGVPQQTFIELTSDRIFSSNSPVKGGWEGNILSINGNGFIKDQMRVHVYYKKCNLTFVSSSLLKCEFFGLNNNREFEVKVEYLNDLNQWIRIDCDDCKYTTNAIMPKATALSNTPDYTTRATLNINFTGNNLFSDDDGNTYDLTKMKVKVVGKGDDYNDVEIAGTLSTGPGTISSSWTNIMAGAYEYRHWTEENGYTKMGSFVPMDPIKPEVTSIATVNSSLLGGNELVIVGEGFPLEKYKHHASVKVCGLPCDITSTKWDEIKCTTPILLTKEVQSTLNMLKPTIQRDALQIWDQNKNYQYLLDGDIYTSSYGIKDNCELKLDFYKGSLIHATKIRMFPRVKRNENDLIGLVFEISKNGTDWEEIIKLNNAPMENWNLWKPDSGKEWIFRYLRLKNNKRYCEVAELEITGFRYADIGTIDPLDHKCDVSVEVMGIPFGYTLPTDLNPAQPIQSDLAKLAAKVAYSTNFTSKVTSIVPNMGTTIGGTEITINGAGFQVSDSTITIDGINCPIDASKSTAAKLVCTTGSRPTFTPSSLEIVSTTQGKVNTDGHLFLYIDRWSSTNTWGGESAPREGDSVHVPKGQVLLVDVSPPPLYAIIVEGTLIFEDIPVLNLHAWFIMVRYGRLEIGMPDKPYEGKLTITMYGDRYSKMLGGFGNKGIFIQDGTIDIHGVPRHPTWTTLEDSVDPSVAGQGNFVLLTEDVDWQVGEEIVIAPTGKVLKEDEVRIITLVENKRKVHFAKKLEFKHFAGDVDMNDTKGEDQKITLRGEVGLLTRNVKIQGDPSTHITGHGAHILLRGAEENCFGRYSYIEVYLAGQKTQLGRYPIHFHMIGSVVDNYVRGNAIHETFNRGTTVHGVHYLTIEKNVYHRTKGHTIFMEDGIETNTIIQDNLVINVRKNTHMLKSDLKPSGIWMARPNNYVRRNHLVGCEGNGTWFELVGHPTGPSATNEICSVRDHLMEYADNIHHSNAIGLRIYPHYFPKEIPCEAVSNAGLRDPFAQNPGKPAQYERNVMYNNGLGSFGKILGRVEYIDMKLISNGSNQKISKPSKAYDSRPRNVGGYSMGQSEVGDFHGNVTGNAINFGTTSGFLVKDTRFYNFPSTSKLFNFCGGCRSETKRSEGGKRQTFENIRFQNVQAKVINYSLPEYDQDIIKDTTGSLFGNLDLTGLTNDYSKGGWITPNNAHLRNVDECEVLPMGNNVSHESVICTLDIDLVVAKMTVLDNYSRLAGQDLKLYNRHINGFNPNMVYDTIDLQKEVFGFSKFRNCQLSIGWRGWAPVLASNYFYNLHFGEGVEWVKLRLSNDYYWFKEGPQDPNVPLNGKRDPPAPAKTEAELLAMSIKPIYFSWNHTEPRELFDGHFAGLNTGKDGSESDAWLDADTTNLLAPANPQRTAQTFNLGAGQNLLQPATIFSKLNTWGDYYHDETEKLLVWKLDGLRKGTLESEAIYCRERCPTEEDTTSGIVYVDKIWSEAADWEIVADVANGIEAQAAGVPIADQEIIVHTNWNMKLDVSSAIVKKITIKGKLYFDPSVDNLELNAFIIVIENGGQLLIGTATAPHILKASINLHGNKDSEYQVISPTIAPVNKAIVNKGKLKIYGTIPKTTWTRLGQKAKSGESHFYTKENSSELGWNDNDELIVASSTTDEAQREKVVVLSTVPSSNEIKIKAPLSHLHWGSSSHLVTTAGTIDMRAEVGNLTRNIKIKSIAGDSWGCTILTPFIPPAPRSDNPPVNGLIIMEGVEIVDCGQRDTAKAAVDIKYSQWENAIKHIIKGCTFNNGQGWAVDLDGAKNIDFINNIIFDSRKTGVLIQGTSNLTFENNLIIGIKKRDNYDNVEYYDILNAIHYNDTTSLKDRNVIIRNNSVSSSPWFGYVVPGYDCNDVYTSTDLPHFYNNTAHSCRAGWFPSKIDNQICNVFANFKGYKNDEQGFQQRVDIFEVRAEKMILVDNRNAFSMNGAPGKNKDYPLASLKDSHIIGKALKDVCPECYEGTDCETNGFYSAIFNNSPYDFYFEKTREPLHNSTSSSYRFGGKQTIENVTFENFQHVDNCLGKPAEGARGRQADTGKSYALRMNNFYQDNTNAIYVSNVTLKEVDDKSKFYFANHKRHLMTPVYCGMRDCTGNYNTPFFDLDGSILQREMHYFGNNLGAGRDGDCTYFDDWNGHACNPVYAQLLMRAPKDNRGLVYFPLKLSIDEYEADVSDDLKFYHEANSATDLTSLVKIEKMTNLTFSATMPSGVQYQLFAAKDTDWAMFKVYSENPATMSIFRYNGRHRVKPIVLKVGETLDLSKKKTQCGANYYDAANRVMYFLLTGKSNCNVTVKLVNSLRLSTRLNIDPADFFSSDLATTFLDRMAALLEIDIDRIRIVDVRQGSTIVETAIDSENDADADRNNKQAVTDELQSFKDKFEAAVNDGTANLGAEVLDVSADLAIDNVPPVTDTNTDTTDPANPDDTNTPDTNNPDTNGTPEPKKKSMGLYIGLGAGGGVVVIIIVTLILYFCVCKKASKSSSKTYHSTNVTKEQQSLQDVNRLGYNINKSPQLGKLGNITRKTAIPQQQGNAQLNDYVARRT